MHSYILLPMLSCVAAIAIASAILARDPGQRANRLVALVLAFSAHWSLCEVVLNLSDEAETAASWIRYSSLGWLWMGPICVDMYLEVLGDARSRLRRLLPFAYATSAILILPYVFTSWFVTGAVPTSWGWGIQFGPLFGLPYAFTLVCVGLVLVRLPQYIAGHISTNERRQARWFMAGIAVPMTLSSITDVLLPLLDIHSPRIGSASLLVLGAGVAWSIRRDGYFLIAPGAFTKEVLETLRDGVALLEVDGNIRSCNGALVRLVGCGSGDLNGTPIASILPEFAADPCKEIRDFETLLAARDGPSIAVSVSSSLLYDEKRDVLGCVIAVQDTREVAGLRNRLVTAGRLAAVGELAAGIAHEINNPISFVRSTLVFLRQQWTRLAEAAEKSDFAEELETIFREGDELIDESVEGVDRIAGIVRDVGAFSHAGRGKAEFADLNQLLDNAANVAALRFTVTIERCFSDVPRLFCVTHEIRQLLLNLLFNALQAVGDSGRIRLVTHASDGFVSVKVEDDGCGMSSEVLEKIFDPFFTTRPAGTATGLGLALAYQIVKNHGGELSVESQPGRGTTFLVRLPIEGIGYPIGS